MRSAGIKPAVSRLSVVLLSAVAGDMIWRAINSALRIVSISLDVFFMVDLPFCGDILFRNGVEILPLHICY